MDAQSQSANPDFKTVRFVYFDLDDTLIDHKRARQRALVDVWTQYPELQQVEPMVRASEFARTIHPTIQHPTSNPNHPIHHVPIALFRPRSDNRTGPRTRPDRRRIRQNLR